MKWQGRRETGAGMALPRADPGTEEEVAANVMNSGDGAILSPMAEWGIWLGTAGRCLHIPGHIHNIQSLCPGFWPESRVR